jgi:tetratricopeptide (TPR) repeat protein
VIARAATVAVVMALSAGAYADNRDTARQAAKEGTKHFDLGEWDEALKSFKRAYMLYEDPTLLWWIAECHRELGQKADAIRVYKNYLRRAPDAANRADVEAAIAKLEAQHDNAPPPIAPPPPPPQAQPGQPPPPPAQYPPAQYPPAQEQAPPPGGAASVYNPWGSPGTLTPSSSYVERPVERQPPRPMSKKLSICEHGSGWAYCDARNDTFSENAFIERYHKQTRSAKLDGYVEKATANKTALITVGALSAVELIAMIASFATMHQTSTTTVQSGSQNYYFDQTTTSSASLGCGIFFTIAFAATTAIGWPLAVRQPVTHHKIPRESAQEFVNFYNQSVGGAE